MQFTSYSPHDTGFPGTSRSTPSSGSARKGGRPISLHLSKKIFLLADSPHSTARKHSSLEKTQFRGRFRYKLRAEGAEPARMVMIAMLLQCFKCPVVNSDYFFHVLIYFVICGIYSDVKLDRIYDLVAEVE